MNFRSRQLIGLFIAFIWFPSTLLAPDTSPPRLSFRINATQQIVISWPEAAGSFVLEEADALGRPTLWKAVALSPQRSGGEFSVTLNLAEAVRFFRLSGAGTTPVVELTRLAESSPSHRETGVAVTRETILRFSGPLAATTQITSGQLHAEFGGRRILSRAELASDHRTLTLFYLETLPAGARLRVTLEGDRLLDAQGNVLDLDKDGKPGGKAVIDFETLGITPVGNTAVIGRVFASDFATGADGKPTSVNRPLGSVIITVDGAEQTLRTFTDSQGNFKLQPAPAGRFFVHVDGRQAEGSSWPNGAYYPFVGKAWDAIAGREDNKAGGTGEIYLPLIKPNTLQPVSLNQDTPITFPAEVLQANPGLQGVSITVPANSLFSDNGTRGGKVGIAPVPPDRLPEKLPPGLNFPLVITVQTDGPSNFDRPVPVRFPNLPDPVTGKILLPGAKSALFSFNHDTGKWEVQGPMTVTSDGKFVESDPGVGIRQPGWHSSGPDGLGDGPFEPDDDDVDQDDAVSSDVVFNPNPPDPPDAPDCPDLSRSFAEFEFAVWLGTQCAGDAATVEARFLSVADAVVTLLTVKQQVEVIVAGYEGGTVSAADVLVAISILEAARSSFEASIDAVRSGPDPALDRLENIVHCLEGVLHQFDLICADLAAAPQECLSESRKSVCAALPRMHDGAAIVTNSIAALRSLSFAALQVKLDDIQAYIMSAPPAALAGLATAPRPDPVLLAKLKDFAASFSGFSILTDDDRHFFQKFITDAHDAYTLHAGATPNAYIRLDYTGVTQYRRANSFGQYSFFMPADMFYSVSAYDPVNNLCGRVWGQSSSPGFKTSFHGPALGACDSVDSDGDGLSDFTEEILGTNPAKRDTDGDGIGDGEEIRSGFDPLDPKFSGRGIIGAAPLNGGADIAVANDIAAVLTRSQSANLSLFNVFNGMPPVLIGQVPLKGFTAARVALSGNLAIVTEPGFGAEVIDFSNPSAAFVRYQFEESAEAVAAAGSTAYIGTSTGEIVAFSLRAGYSAARLKLGESVSDVAVQEDRVYALADGKLHVVRAAGFELSAEGSVAVPEDARRLAVSGNVAYVVHSKGFDTYNIANPSQPVLIAAAATDRPNWFDLALNGSGLGIAAAGSASDANLLLFDTSDPAKTGQFLSEIITPGHARAVAINNGVAYVAESTGLVVVRYQALDTAGKQPSIALKASFALEQGSVEENSPAWVSAAVGDDMQVRDVEFLIDGVRVAKDGSAPFEHHFVGPLAAGRSSFRVQARATDTGGKSTPTREFVVRIAPDRTAPVAQPVTPPDGKLMREYLPELVVVLSEPVPPAQLTPDTVQIFTAGPDGRLGTDDDARVGRLGVEWRLESQTLSVRLAENPLNGQYRAVVKAGLRDLAGNASTTDVAWTFSVVDNTGPQIVAMSPGENETSIGEVTEILVRFNEPMNAATLTPETLTLIDAGPDGYIGTADDARVTPKSVEYRAADFTARLILDGVLPPRRYLVRVASTVANYNGFRMGRDFRSDRTWRFIAPVRTTVRGTAVLEDGSPAVGANVSFAGFPGSTLADAKGQFSFAGVLVLPGNQLAVTVNGNGSKGEVFIGRAEHLKPTHGGITEAGIIHLKEVCEPRFSPGLFPPLGLEYFVRAFTLFNDGKGATVYAASYDGIHRWTGEGWIRLPGEFKLLSNNPGELSALAVYNDGTGEALYVGGSFKSVDNLEVAGLAKWDGKKWSAVGPLLSGRTAFGGTLPVEVRGLTVLDDGQKPALIVGGSFGKAGDVDARDLARWNGTAWSGIGSIETGTFGSGVLASFNDGVRPALYVAGNFTRIAGVPVKGFAKWDGQQWSAMDSGTVPPESGLKSGVVRTMVVYKDGPRDALFVGGIFDTIGGVTANGIARWNGTTWSALGAGLGSGVPGRNAQATSLAVFNDGRGQALYVSGDFTEAGSAYVNGIARWDGKDWNSLGQSNRDAFIPAGSGNAEAMIGFNDGLESALFVGVSQAIVAEGETRIDIPGQSVMRWTGSRWLPAGGGLPDEVKALTTFDDAKGSALIAGGAFSFAGVSKANGIAKREGDHWVPLGDGFGQQVDVLKTFNDASGRALYAAGQASTPEGLNQIVIGKWNGQTWTRVGASEPLGFVSAVRVMEVFDDGSGSALYVGGSFSTINGVSVGGIAKWNGQQWAAVGKGLGDVWALTVFDEGSGPALYAGGNISDGSGSLNVARWDGKQWGPTTSQFTPVSGTFGTVFTLAVHDDGTGPALYAAGNIERIVKLTRDGWLQVGTFPPGYRFPSFSSVRSLVSFDDGSGAQLYAGGDFGSADLNPFAFAARLVGNEWSVLGSGLDSRVNTMTAFTDAQGPALYLGGNFQRAGGARSVYLARWHRPVAPCPRP